MPLAGEAKAEWRRRNRQKIYAQKLKWLASRRLADASAGICRGSTREVPNRECECGATIWGRGKYCSPACRAGRLKKYPGVRTWRVIYRMVDRLNRRIEPLLPAALMANAVARSLAILAVRRPASGGEREQTSQGSWDEATHRCVVNLRNEKRRFGNSAWWCKLLRLTANLNFRATMGRPARIKATDIRAILEQQGFRCAYTGEELTPGNVSADHVVPLSRGGSHTIDNVRLVTRDVNIAKGTLLLADFVDLCRRVVAHFDNQEVLSGDQAEDVIAGGVSAGNG